MTIPIRNLYFIFCYAWAQFPGGDTVDVGVDECPDLQNLFGKVLVEGVNRLMRRGLDRGYREFVEETRSPRGRILLDETSKGQTMRRGAVICRFDDLSHDVLHNQIIKAVARLLARERSMAKELAHELRAIDRKLGAVSDIRLSGDVFKRVQLSRNTGQYAMLMQLCEFVFRSMMPEAGGVGSRFADVLEDEAKMSTVFEEFLRNFYQYEQSSYRVSREGMQWDADGSPDPLALRYLPRMLTDVTFLSPERVKVFDAKFYKTPFVDRYGAPKINSNNLYQIVTYLQHAGKKYPGRGIDGALVYASAGSPVSLEYRLLGFDVRIEAVDLTAAWQDIRATLLRLLDPSVTKPMAPEVQHLTI